MTRPKIPITGDIFAVTLTLLHAQLRSAEDATAHAADALADGYRDRAMSYLLEVERLLPKCDALCRATLLVHEASAPLREKGGAA